jgi:hypothetical protein
MGVETTNGTAKLTGSVVPWSEHDATLAAWAAPSAINVDDPHQRPPATNGGEAEPAEFS